VARHVDREAGPLREKRYRDDVPGPFNGEAVITDFGSSR
jgi:hypothetical protein